MEQFNFQAGKPNE